MELDFFDTAHLHAPDKHVSKSENAVEISYGSTDLLFHREHNVNTSHWQIPWSDLMMTMFILFAVMYVYASAKNQVKLPTDNPTHFSKISRVYDLSRNALQGEGIEKLASVQLVPDQAVKILLTSDLIFDTGKAALKPGAIHALKKIASILRSTDYPVTLAGHTDNIPIHTEYFPSNWELSAARASAVARFLIDQMHIPSERFCVSGYADMRPLRSNDSDENRAVNRRVEITVTKT